VPTLLMREVLIPKNFFEGYFVSQFGPLDESPLLDKVIVSAALPLRNASAPMMRAYGLETVVHYTRAGFRAIELPGTLDRFTLVPEVRVASDPRELWAAGSSPDWDPARVALLREPLPEPTLAASTQPTGQGAFETNIRIVHDEADVQTLEVDSRGGLLVTSELMFPGWEVRVDGEPAHAIEVDFALRGVAVGPGRHRVEWNYLPTWLTTATLASLFGAGLLGALVLVPRRLDA
jgi:hypothetical protein